MATIDELDFKLVVDDADFNAKVAAAKQSALEMNTALSQYLTLVGKINSTSVNGLTGWTQMATEAKNLKSAMEQVLQTIKDTKTESKDIAKNIKNAGKEATDANKKITKIKDSLSAAATSSNTMATAMGKVDNKAQSATDKLKDLEQAAQDAAAATQGITVNLTGAAGSADQQKNTFGSLTRLAATYFSVHYVKNFATEVARVTGEFELQRTSLQNILQDVSGANKIFEQIKDFSVESPFQFKDLTNYVKQLSAFSVPMDELFDTTKMLADVSAGLGVDMNRIVLAYGQIRSASFLRGQEVRQLTEAGIPILEELRKQFEEMGEIGITAGQVFDKISNRQVGFEMVQKVFKNMTEEGGKFYHMQEVQAATLAGKISNLKDAYDIMLNSFGEATRGPLVGAIDTLKKLMDHYQAVGRVLVDIFAMFGSYATVGALTKIGKLFGEIGTAMSGATGLMNKLNAGMKALSLSAGGVYAALAALVTLLGIQLYNHLHRVDNELDKIVNKNFTNFSKDASSIDKLVASLKNATKGSQEYRDIISKLNSQYGDYLDNLATEANTYDEIALAAEKAKTAIAEKNQADARESGLKKINELHGDKLSDYTEQMIAWLTDPKSFDTNISEKAASKIINDFKNNLQKGLSEGKTFYTIFDEALKNYAPNITMLKSSPGMLIAKLGDELREEAKDIEKLDAKLSALYGTSYYNSAEEEKIIGNIESKFEGLFSHVNRLELPLEKVNEEIHTLEVSRLEQLIEAYEKLGRTDMVNKYKKELADLTKVQTGWRKVVGDVLNDKSLNFKDSTKKFFETNDGEQFLEWLKKLRDEYSKLDQNIKDTSNEPSLKDELERYKDEKRAAEELARMLGVDLAKPAQQRSALSQANSSAEQNIRNRVSQLKSVRDLYEQMLEYMDEAAAKEEVKTYLPEYADVVELGSFRQALEECADEMQEFDAVAAEKIRVDNKIDELRRYEKTLEDLKKYQSDINDFVSGGDLSGEGVSFDISKIVKKYQDALNSISKKRQELVEETQIKYRKGELSDEDYNENLNQIFGAETRQNANAMATAFESLRDQADKFVKDWAKNEKHIDLSNWSHKSVAELDNIIKELDLLSTSELPENIQDSFEGLDAELEVFKKKLLEVIDSYKSEVNGAKGKKTFWENLFPGLDAYQVKEKVRAIKAIANSVKELMSSLSDFAESTNDSKLQSSLSAVSDIVDIGTSIASGFAAGGPWAAVAAGIAAIGSKALESAKNSQVLKAAIDDARMSARSDDWARMLDYTDDIFGDSFTASLRNAMTVTRQTSEALRELNGRFTKAADELRALKEAGMNFSKGSGLKERLGEINEALEKGYSDMEAYAIEIRGKGLFNSDEFRTLKDLAEEIGMSLTDTWGNLDAKTLQKILDTYNVDSMDAEWIKKAIADSQAYSDAMTQLVANLENLFGSLADTIADNMISAFEETGDAMYDLSDDFANVGKQLTKSLLSSLIIEGVFQKYKDLLVETSKKYGDGNLSETEMMGQVADIMGQMQSNIESQADVYNAILQYADELGFLTDSEKNGMSDGIKGITEETADLLASYINAIRADVSYAKTQRETIIGQIQQIINGLPAAPNLQFYMSQIEANTANIAESSASILERIDSVLTTEGGSSAIRTYAY